MTKRKETHTASGIEVKYDFSSTMWYGADLAKLKEHLRESIGLVSSYPERFAETIGRLLSRRIEVAENQLLVTDGATGAIHLIARVAEKAKSVVLTPANIEFKHALEIAGHDITEVSDQTDFDKLPLTGADFCWISTPNAVTGTLPTRKSLVHLLKAYPQVTFIIDLSTSAFALEDTIKPSDIKKYPNLIVLSSFSCAYNLPGMRVGYIVAPAKVIQTLDREYTPRCVSTLAMEAIRYILIHPAQFTIPIRKWHRIAQDLVKELSKIEGLKVVYTNTPYFVVQLRNHDVTALHNYLLQEHAIKVGTLQDDIDLAPNEIRITAQHAEANEALINALLQYLN